MRPARFLKIAVAAAIAAILAAEGWWLTEGYRDARACLIVLPALEESGELVVGSLRRSDSLPGVFEIGYRATDTAGSRSGRLRCAFGDGPDGRRHLLGVEFDGQPIGEARLYFLERFWLGDPAAVRSGEARLRSDVPPLAFLAAMIGRPHPSLIGALLCALLAAAALAAGRLTERRQRG
ncbi:hypothetical protein KL86PLE_110106 [uncultured Pleomorphomonas sp.]|uniref:Transmembrane protein n=1 Tax=uncultured Pleomorphomonas sp. TaxID=442121 RepID=A0A212L7H9_9HYPH|nr:hypothetical protein [uncultured Pleomorphomonas sp.]SCM73533.1 hypothetical protein KL86PLE_110106 [uncultured Pleomorphomonas sp.]